jgi:hypothetical protein
MPAEGPTLRGRKGPAGPRIGAKRIIRSTAGSGSVSRTPPGRVAKNRTDREVDMSMAEPTLATPDQTAGIVKLRLTLPARLDLERVPALLGGPDADWLGQRLSEKASELRRYSCDLELRVDPDRRATFAKSAIVSFGELERVDHAWVVPIEWRAATLTPLFPVFVGRLRLRAEWIELDGHYAPPGGTIGYLLDRALLHHAARATGRWFLGKVVAALDGTLVGAGGPARTR